MMLIKTVLYFASFTCYCSLVFDMLVCHDELTCQTLTSSNMPNWQVR